MEATKAKDLIKFCEKNYNAHNKMINSAVAWQAVELAESELKDKSIKSFCKATCPNDIRCKKTSTPYSCMRVRKFITELNL